MTKSGTNDFHGSVFDYYRDKQLNTNDYINVINGRVKSPYHFDQYGFTAGGPIVRDKHFFFANWDRQRNSTPNPVVLASGRITTFPTDAASQAALATIRALGGDYNRQLNQDVYLLKTDHELLTNHHVSLRYNRQRFTGVNFENSGIDVAVGHSGNSSVATDSLSGVYDSTFGSSFFNEVRAQYLKDREPGEANSADPETAVFSGNQRVLLFGRNSFSPRETTIKRYQVADTATYILQNHTLKGGFDYSHDNIFNYFPGNFFGSYRFNSLADFTNKNAFSFLQAFPGPGTTGPITRPNLKETGLFIQDEWRVMPSLTLNAGLRFDRQGIAQPTVLNPDAQLQAAGYTTNKIPVDNNIGPRLGFAWTPSVSSNTVVHGGYGVFYGRTPSIMIGTAMSNNGINVQTITFTGNQIPVYPAIYPSLPSGTTLPKPTIFVFDQRFKSPKVQQANLGVEHQLGGDVSVGITYLYVKADDLPRSRDVNVSGPTTITANIAGDGTTTYTRYLTKPLANFNRVIAFESSARSKYNGLTLDLQKRFSNNWQSRISWTHGMVKDNKPDATAVVPGTDDAKYVSDPLNIDKDYTYGDTDVRDRVVISGVFSLDSYGQAIKNNVMRSVASGWTISGIISYQTGQPFTPNVLTDLNNDGNSTNDVAPGFRRNSFRYPTQFSVDPRITRDIPLLAGTKLTLIAEAFNVLNKHNVTTENRTYYGFSGTDTPTCKAPCLTRLIPFGTPTVTLGQRVVQLAGKVTF